MDHRRQRDRTLSPTPGQFLPHEDPERNAPLHQSPTTTPSLRPSAEPNMPSPIFLPRPELSQSQSRPPSPRIDARERNSPPPAPLSTPMPRMPEPVLLPTPMPVPTHAAVPISIESVAGPSRPPTRSPPSEKNAAEVSVQLPPTRSRMEQRTIGSTGHGMRADSGGSALSAPRPTHPVRALSWNGSRNGLVDRPPVPMGMAYNEIGRDGFLPRQSGLDYVVPVMGDDEKRRSGLGASDISAGEKKIADRLERTLAHANEELGKAQRKAKLTGYALNACIAAQVVFGALTTGVAASTTGRQTSIATSVLGGLSTLAASYLARARGSGQPENAIIRVHDLEHFIRDCEAFLVDQGHLTGAQFDSEVQRYRKRFEEIMGNSPTKNGVAETFKEKVVTLPA